VLACFADWRRKKVKWNLSRTVFLRWVGSPPTEAMGTSRVINIPPLREDATDRSAIRFFLAFFLAPHDAILRQNLARTHNTSSPSRDIAPSVGAREKLG
jgi:hypothetical protein